ncbi:MAG: aspartate carbamoyltransferase regulatory subunit [Bacteroidetes bacterium]|nr:MAG: aspartate carbamoyltransferase regulatory subunit [Bacteroidota bacterium]
MNEKVKELKVSAIENGTVIDHIPANALFQVIKMLKLDVFDQMVLFATNLESKKFGSKGIIKVSNKFFKPEELNKIALVAPHASIIEIRDYRVSMKTLVEIPETVSGIVKCFNPNCITNIEVITTRFAVVDKEDIRLKCHYCEKITVKNNIVFK